MSDLDSPQKDRIDVAHAHMAEVDAARLRGEETEDEKRLNDAREGVVEEVPPPGRARKHRPSPSQAAQAWLRRRERERTRKTITLALPIEATEIWREVQRQEGVIRILPADAGQRSASTSRSIKAQVWIWVRSTPGFVSWVKGWMTDEEFHARIAAWPLPKSFVQPLPDLCPAEADEQERGRAEIEEAVRLDDGGRLMRGMVRSE